VLFGALPTRYQSGSISLSTRPKIPGQLPMTLLCLVCPPLLPHFLNYYRQALQFLAMLKEKCSQTDKEWEERQKTRSMELEACSKALSVLSSDDAHDLFTKTFNPALLQSESQVHSDRRAQASKLLASAAQKLKLPHLATLATQVRLDAFTRVKKSIDDMVSQLIKENQDEIKHKDFCVEEFNTNELQTEKKERAKQDLTAKIEDLESTIDALTKAIDQLKSEIAEMQISAGRWPLSMHRL
jgi:hypothetical protein